MRLFGATVPNDGEVAGLFALTLLTDARRAAREGPLGELIPLDEQDRSLWNDGMIAEGIALISAVMTNVGSGPIGPYRLQAAIAALHDEAPSSAHTDWAQILEPYLLLERISDNPVVSLNRAVASAMVNGAEAGLAEVELVGSDPRIACHYRLDAVRAHLLERIGDAAGAIAHYRAATDRTASIPERGLAARKGGAVAPVSRYHKHV